MSAKMMEWMEDALAAIRPDVMRFAGAAAGAVCAWFTGLPPIAQALLVTQGADVLTGVLGAVMGRSPKTESGRVSSHALSMGMIKKGLEWLVVLICAYVGAALKTEGITGAAMTYMIATEMVSLVENLSLFGLKVPALERLLDIAQEEGRDPQE
ncbi:MAG: phage holin family protein [Clostridia bacterium]|nr:phage holin family protein [Clostridia bacterium]MBQ4608409.1 phage holin family protein [Clostridia bacterium]MBQ6859113.1 phage holin family protein [Clostridia bacterium]